MGFAATSIAGGLGAQVLGLVAEFDSLAADPDPADSGQDYTQSGVIVGENDCRKSEVRSH